MEKNLQLSHIDSHPSASELHQIQHCLQLPFKMKGQLIRGTAKTDSEHNRPDIVKRLLMLTRPHKPNSTPCLLVPRYTWHHLKSG